MGSQTAGGSDNKQAYFQPLARQNSMYNLTLDEVQTQLGDMGKPLSSMNLEELLRSVWTVESNQSVGTSAEVAAPVNQNAFQHQENIALTSDWGKRTVDEVWRDIQESKNEVKKTPKRQGTLGEMTLEDFLVKAGIVAAPPPDIKTSVPNAEMEPNIAPNFQQGQWTQYPQPQYQHLQQGMMGLYVTGQPIPQPMHMAPGQLVDVALQDNPVAVPPPVIAGPMDAQAPVRKRGAPDDMLERTVERRQKRMIKNRESAARSRARKQVSL